MHQSLPFQNKITKQYSTPAYLARWTRLISGPVSSGHDVPIGLSRGVILRTTTQWRHSLQWYRYASIWPITCKCDDIHKTGSTYRIYWNKLPNQQLSAYVVGVVVTVGYELSRRLSILLHVYVRTSVGFRLIQLKVTCKRCRQLFFVIVDGETMLLKKVLTGSFTFKSIDPCDLSSCTKRCHFIPYPDQRYNLWIKICWISENQSVRTITVKTHGNVLFRLRDLIKFSFWLRHYAMGLQTIKPHRSAYSYLAHDAAYYCICSVVYLCVSVCVCL